MADMTLLQAPGKTHYFVVCDTEPPNGGTRGLSRTIERLSILHRVLKRVRRSVPHAYAIQETIFR